MSLELPTTEAQTLEYIKAVLRKEDGKAGFDYFCESWVQSLNVKPQKRDIDKTIEILIDKGLCERVTLPKMLDEENWNGYRLTKEGKVAIFPLIFG